MRAKANYNILPISRWFSSLLRFMERHYQDIVTTAFILLVYPLLTSKNNLSPQSTYWNLVCGLWFLMGIVGIVGNILKLSSLNFEIHKHKLQVEVKAPVARFLGAWIALPLQIVMPMFMFIGPEMSENLLGFSFLSVGLILWIFFLKVGTGAKKSAVPKKRRVITTNIMLIIFELTLYTIFLETLFMNEGVGVQSLSTLLMLSIPMALLFFLLFWPATIGFYIEAIVHHKSRRTAFTVLLYRFIIFRYLPIFGVFLLKQS